MASRTAVKCPSAPFRSAAYSAAWPSQKCAAHHTSPPGLARPAAWRSSENSPAPPRSSHHGASATARRAAMAASWSMAQVSTWRMVASSASSLRAAAASAALVCSTAAGVERFVERALG